VGTAKEYYDRAGRVRDVENVVNRPRDYGYEGGAQSVASGMAQSPVMNQQKSRFSSWTGGVRDWAYRTAGRGWDYVFGNMYNTTKRTTASGETYTNMYGNRPGAGAEQAAGVLDEVVGGQGLSGDVTDHWR